MREVGRVVDCLVANLSFWTRFARICFLLRLPTPQGRVIDFDTVGSMFFRVV